ncbi:MAG: glycosyltransferase family 39 protein [Chitinophagales bacterium]
MNISRNNILRSHKELFLLLFIAALLGFYKLGERPLPVNQDELSNIYDAYSISKTGSDRFGHKYPVVLEGFGKADYRPSLYAWLSVIPIKIRGLSVTSGRSISVICFIGCVLFLYLSSLLLFGKPTAFITSIIFIFSPWSWFFARIAHEGAMLPSLFIAATLYLFIRVYKEKHHQYLYFILLGFTIGFSTNAYQSSRLIAFLVAFLVFIFLVFETIEQKNKKIFLFIIACFVGAAPQIYIFIFYPDLFYGRYHSVQINQGDAFENVYTFINNIYTDLSPEFLFFGFGKTNSISISRFLEIESIFFYTGLISIFTINKSQNRKIALFLVLLLITTIVPCSLTDHNPNALRLSCMLLVCPIFIGAGFHFFVIKIKNDLIRNGVILSAIITIIISFNIQYNKYKHNQTAYDNDQQNNLVQLSQRLNTCYKKYDTIFFEESGNQPYIYFLFYCHIEPLTFRSMDKIHDNSIEFYTYEKMGNFYFISYDDILKFKNETHSNNLIISTHYPHELNIKDSVVTTETIYYFSENKKSENIKPL